MLHAYIFLLPLFKMGFVKFLFGFAKRTILEVIVLYMIGAMICTTSV